MASLRFTDVQTRPTEFLDEILTLVAWVQRRNHRASLAHRKRRGREG